MHNFWWNSKQSDEIIDVSLSKWSKVKKIFLGMLWLAQNVTCASVVHPRPDKGRVGKPFAQGVKNWEALNGPSVTLILKQMKIANDSCK